MTFLLLLPAILSFLLLGAHFLRAHDLLLTGLSVLMPLLLIVQHRAILWILQALLLLSTAEWAFTLGDFVSRRLAEHQRYTAGTIIFASVIALNLAAALLLLTRRVRTAYPLQALSDASPRP